MSICTNSHKVTSVYHTIAIHIYLECICSVLCLCTKFELINVQDLRKSLTLLCDYFFCKSYYYNKFTFSLFFQRLLTFDALIFPDQLEIVTNLTALTSLSLFFEQIRRGTLFVLPHWTWHFGRSPVWHR